jgi:thiopeptide-type bacteriocin biosynthesis protein
MPAPDAKALVWRSVHVHRYGGQDEFLVAGLAPAITSLRQAGAVAGFFFLRYWQGGHHIRIRVRVAQEEADAVAGELTAKLGGYLAEHPAGRDFDADAFGEAQPTMAALEGVHVEPIQPPDTIRHARYVPEYDKYGGERGVVIAEEFFDCSSAIVLDQLAGAAWRSSRRLGSGFVAMLRGLHAAGLPPSSMARFFAHYCVLWSPYVFDRFSAAWPQLLSRQQPALRAHAAVILGSLTDPTDPFSAAMSTACTAVDANAADVLPNVTLAGPDAPADRRQQVLLVGFLHTHNNRLGLIPEQEAFLGYLGHHVLSEYTGSPPDAELMARVAAARDRTAGGTRWT